MTETTTKSLISYFHPIKQFQRWWIDELSDIAEKLFRKNNLKNQDILLFKPENDTLNISHRTDLAGPQTAVSFSELSNFPVGTTEIIFQAPESYGLCKRMTLPLAAKADLRAILFNQIDRITPFTADQIYFDYRIIDDGSSSDHIEFDFFIIPKIKLKSEIEQITDHGISIDRIILENTDHEMNFLPLREDNKASENNNTSIFKFWLMLAIFLGVLLVPTGYYEYQINGLQKSIDETALKARGAIEVNALFESHKSDMIYIVEKKQNSPLIITIINEISELLDDDTWLDQLVIKGDSIQLYGYSASATKTLEKLDQSFLFKNAKFMAAVVQNNIHNAERFQISLDLSGAGS